MTKLLLIGKPDCHLCEVAREIVDLVIAGLPEDEAEQVEVAEASILDDADLYEQWWEKIPVVLIDDDVHAYWRLDAARLRAELLRAISS